MQLIFVFGSNLAGRHGKGAARHAVQEFGAIYGLGVGPQGRAYAIPTKDFNLVTLPLPIVDLYIEQFNDYTYLEQSEWSERGTSKNQPKYLITRLGCGLAGWKDANIAPYFAKRMWPTDCMIWPIQWKPWFANHPVYANYKWHNEGVIQDG